jgi:type I restriction enzyme M protein
MGFATDEKGFCRSVKLDEIRTLGFALSPGRFVGAPESEEQAVAFEEQMATLVDKLADEMAENDRLAGEVRAAFAQVGYEL